MCLCRGALIQSCVKQQESFPWLQWFGDLALMLSLRNKQKLLLWQSEIIVSVVCHSAPAPRANKAQLTSRSAQPEMHFRKAFARALSNQSDKYETNVTAIFSSTKLRFINTYSWLGKKKKIHGLASQGWFEYTRQCRNPGAAVSHTIEAELVFGAAGSELCRVAREVHRGSGLGGWFHRSQTLAMCGKCNKNLHWSRQQVLIQQLALASQTWTPFYDFNLFYLLMQLMVLESLSGQGRETEVRVCSKAFP